MSTTSYQVRYAHTTQRETFATEDAAIEAVESVFPGCHWDRYDGLRGTEISVWRSPAAADADLDGSRTCARIVPVVAEVQS